MNRDSAKNILIGFLMGVCLMLIIGARPRRTPPGQQNGRYIISSGHERTYFVMDTRTGDHWYEIAERTGHQGNPEQWKTKSR